MKPETANSSIAYGERLMLKLYRRLEDGINPDLEVGRFLSEHAFGNTPALLGAIEYEKPQAEPKTLAVMQAFVQNQGDAWQFTREELRRYYERAAARGSPGATGQARGRPALRGAAEPRRGRHDRRLPGGGAASWAADCRAASGARFRPGARFRGGALQHALPALDVPIDAQQHRARLPLMGSRASRRWTRASKVHAGKLQEQHDRILALFDAFLKRKVASVRMRCHGDLHLGQVLYTGKDFLVIDFEGDAGAPAQR